MERNNRGSLCLFALAVLRLAVSSGRLLFFARDWFTILALGNECCLPGKQRQNVKKRGGDKSALDSIKQGILIMYMKEFRLCTLLTVL